MNQYVPVVIEQSLNADTETTKSSGSGRRTGKFPIQSNSHLHLEDAFGLRDLMSQQMQSPIRRRQSNDISIVNTPILKRIGPILRADPYPAAREVAGKGRGSLGIVRTYNHRHRQKHQS